MKLDRRTLLKSIAGAAAATALDPLVPRISAQTSDPKRFVYWYTPVMPKAEVVDPMYQASPGPIAFAGAFAPLNGVASKLSFVRNLENAAEKDCEGGDGPHPRGGTTYLLGRSFGTGLGGDLVNGRASVGPHSSLDQYLAQQFEKRGESTFISDLRMGLKNEGKNGNCDKSISLRDGRIRLRHQNARDALTELMPLSANPGGGNDGNAIRRRSVLDVTRGALSRLHARLGTEDRARLDAHLEAVRSLEKRIDQAESAARCDLGAIDANVPNLEREDVAQDLSIEVMTLALACGATRVAGAQWGPNTCNLTFDFLPDKRNGGSNWHQSTHEAGNDAYHRGVLNFQAKQFRKLVESLESVVEPSGKTLLDNTVVLWYTDVSRDHSSEDSFCLLAGGSHYFRHGNMVNATGNVNRALTSIMHAMDVDGDTFGDPKYGTGELSLPRFGGHPERDYSPRRSTNATKTITSRFVQERRRTPVDGSRLQDHR